MTATPHTAEDLHHIHSVSPEAHAAAYADAGALTRERHNRVGHRSPVRQFGTETDVQAHTRAHLITPGLISGGEVTNA